MPADSLVPHAVVELAAIQDMNAVKAWRTHLGLTQAEVAARMGVSQSAYAKLELSPQLAQSLREQVAAALGITPGQLDF